MQDLLHNCQMDKHATIVLPSSVNYKTTNERMFGL